MRLGLCLASVLLALCAACAGSQKDEEERGEPAFPDDELDAVAAEIVRAHNDARASASPTPSPVLPDVSWDEDVAAIAQAWAEGCVFEHSTSGLGENLAFFSGDASTGAQVVALWASEAEFFDYASNTCAAGQQCGHYTQVVWRTSTSIGCGAALCNVSGWDGLLWVCNYDPPGNFIGERPY